MKKTDSYQFRGLLAGILLLVIVLISILLMLFLPSHRANDSLVATISKNGEVVRQINFKDVTESYEILLTDEEGHRNVILVTPTSISMKEASCPDKLCVKMGTSGASLLPIICLPNQVSITLSQSAATQDMDAVTY